MTDPRPVPLSFDVLPKAAVWGGTLLHERYGKPKPPGSEPCGETWEVVDLPKDQSVVREGALKGRTLGELVRDHRTWLMGAAELLDGRFPLLLKLIDAQRTLSVQVHPDATAAAALGGRPKTEAWVILDVAEGGCLYLGMKPTVTRDELHEACAGPSLEHLLNRVEVKPGDVVFIPSGTVHAIGAGILLAELQQASDTTYRLHDWGRMGLDGKPRQLHIEQALESIDFTPEGLNQWRLSRGPGRVVSGPVFVMEVHDLQAGRSAAFDHDCPFITMSLEGRFQVEAAGGLQEVESGGTALVPASARRTVVTSKGDERATTLVGWPV